MLKGHCIAPGLTAYLEAIGIERPVDLMGADPREIAMRIDISLGRRHMNRLGIEALANPIALADPNPDPAATSAAPAGQRTLQQAQGRR